MSCVIYVTIFNVILCNVSKMKEIKEKVIHTKHMCEKMVNHNSRYVQDEVIREYMSIKISNM
jgi:hypothetical protein